MTTFLVTLGWGALAWGALSFGIVALAVLFGVVRDWRARRAVVREAERITTRTAA